MVRALQMIMEGRTPSYDQTQLIELLKSGRNIYDAGRSLGLNKSQIQDAIKAVRLKIEKHGLVLPDNAMVRPKIMRGDYDAADMVFEILNRDEEGNLPTLEAITMNLKGDITDATFKAIRVQVLTFQRQAKEAVDAGEEGIKRLSYSWNVTPDRVIAVAKTIGERRGPSINKLIRQQIEKGNLVPKDIFAAIKNQALQDRADDPKAIQSLRSSISMALKKSRGTDIVPQQSTPDVNQNKRRTAA